MHRKKLRPWKTLEKRVLLEPNKFLRVESHSIKLPDGEVLSDWPWLIIPDAAIVVARTNEGSFLCFRQTKYAVEGSTLAPVGGMLEPGEAPLEAAKRELLEETGYASKQWTPLGSYIMDPNRGIATMHLFLALDAEYTAEPICDDLEDQELLLLDQDTLQAALDTGEIKIVSWVAAIALAFLKLSQKGKQ